MFKNSEVYQIYEHISGMCRYHNPAEACRLIANFCRSEMAKIATKEDEEWAHLKDS